MHAAQLVLGELSEARLRLGLEVDTAPLRLCGWWTTVRRGSLEEQLDERRRLAALFPRAEGIADISDAAAQHASACRLIAERTDQDLEQAARAMWEEVAVHVACMLERIPAELRAD